MSVAAYSEVCVPVTHICMRLCVTAYISACVRMPISVYACDCVCLCMYVLHLSVRVIACQYMDSGVAVRMACNTGINA